MRCFATSGRGARAADLELPPSALAIEAGDLLTLSDAARPERLIAERDRG